MPLIVYAFKSLNQGLSVDLGYCFNPVSSIETKPQPLVHYLIVSSLYKSNKNERSKLRYMQYFLFYAIPTEI